MRYMKYFIIILMGVFFFTTDVLAIDSECLKDIKIGEKKLEGFNPTKYEYSIDVAAEVTELTISPTLESGYKIYSQSNSKSLKYGANKIEIIAVNKDVEDDTCKYTLTINRADGRSSDNNLNSLKVGNDVVKLSNDKTTYDVNVNSELKTVEVRAVPSHAKAELVQGYGERIGNNAVPLSGDKTTIEIHVKAENGNVRKYIINLLRTDVKDSDATLKTLTVTNTEFEFKSNLLEYELKVANEVNKVKVNATPNSEKSKVEFTEDVTLAEGDNNVLIKVTAEDETTKTYTLKIIREAANTDLLIKKLTIDGITLKFDPNKFSYKVTSNLEKLNINVTLYNEKAIYEILNNENLMDGSVIGIKVTFEGKEQIYQITVNKEIVEDATTSNNESENKIDAFLNKYEMLIASGIIGVGLFSMLVAILTKPKKINETM